MKGRKGEYNDEWKEERVWQWMKGRENLTMNERGRKNMTMNERKREYKDEWKEGRI